MPRGAPGTLGGHISVFYSSQRPFPDRVRGQNVFLAPAVTLDTVKTSNFKAKILSKYHPQMSVMFSLGNRLSERCMTICYSEKNLGVGAHIARAGLPKPNFIISES